MRILVLLIALSAAASSQQLVRVLSYNIHHGEGTDGKIDLPRIAGVINSVQPDVVALQEVDILTQRSGGTDQLLELARLTGLHPVFGQTISHQGGLYGNAVLARRPLAGFSNHPLAGREPRAVIDALIAPAPGASGLDEYRFLATHLDLNETDRLAAAHRIEQIVNSWPEPTPAILAGDINAVPDSKPIAALSRVWTAVQGASPLLTSPAQAPRRQIDYIFVRPASRWRVVEVRVLDEPVASDHRPIFAVLELLPDPASSERIHRIQ